MDFVAPGRGAAAAVNEYRYDPLPSTQWASVPLPDGATHYCYLCSVGPVNTESAHRQEIEAFLFNYVDRFTSEDLCQKVSTLYQNRIVENLPPQERPSKKWWPQTIYKHLTEHVQDYRSELINSIWKLRDYDRAYTEYGRAYDLERRAYVAPPEPEKVKMHVFIMKQTLDAFKQLATLNKKAL